MVSYKSVTMRAAIFWWLQRIDVNDNIYHEGNISKLPDFDVFFSFRYL